ncbi:hypothetical protein KCP74_03365 [Salmonella enterica subsp. enterica]|nr:hypothetical protein KCP74_03365 [Salmonella enterica subsp. enterica]
MVSNWSAGPAGGLPLQFYRIAQGEYLFRHHDADFKPCWLYIFAQIVKPMPGAVSPSPAGMGLFVLFPLVCTIAIASPSEASSTLKPAHL